MIDLHSHVLPGVDDGAETLAESVEIARAAAADGTVVLAATPHVRDDYPTEPETMRRLVAEVERAVAAAGLAVRIVPGGEVALLRLERLSEEGLRAFALAGNPRYLLVELPYTGWPLDTEERLFRLAARGIVAVLAHPERHPHVQERPERLAPLVERGALVQLTAASVDGRLGRRAQATSERLLAAGLAHMVASDAHAPAVRATGLSAAARAVGSPELARWLTHDVPRSIVERTPLPPRPAAPHERRGILRLLRR